MREPFVALARNRKQHTTEGAKKPRPMQERSDEQLMAAVMAGDQVALAALVTRHHAPLLGYLYRLVGGDRQLSEDLVQETLLHVLRQSRAARCGQRSLSFVRNIASWWCSAFIKDSAYKKSPRRFTSRWAPSNRGSRWALLACAACWPQYRKEWTRCPIPNHPGRLSDQRT